MTASFGKGHHLHLIDGSAYIFRAYHALPPLTRKSDGLPVGAVAGFCNILWNEISSDSRKGAATHIAVIFDHSSKTFRNDITDPAIVAAAELSHRYITDRFLPDKAIDLIDEAAAKIKIEIDSKPEVMDKLDRRMIQLKIEREAVRKEKDEASIKRSTSAATAHETAAPSSRSDITVTFAKSGQQAQWSPQSGSLLEFAEAQGIAIDSGCRAGGCGTCQTTIQTGEVAYSQSPDYDPEPGTCLMCVCIPKTHVTLEA